MPRKKRFIIGNILNCRNRLSLDYLLNSVDKKKVVPGDTLRLEVKIEKLKKNAGIGQGTAYVGDKVAAQAELVFMIG